MGKPGDTTKGRGSALTGHTREFRLLEKVAGGPEELERVMRAVSRLAPTSTEAEPEGSVPFPALLRRLAHA